MLVRLFFWFCFVHSGFHSNIDKYFSRFVDASDVLVLEKCVIIIINGGHCSVDEDDWAMKLMSTRQSV